MCPFLVNAFICRIHVDLNALIAADLLPLFLEAQCDPPKAML